MNISKFQQKKVHLCKVLQCGARQSSLACSPTNGTRSDWDTPDFDAWPKSSGCSTPQYYNSYMAGLSATDSSDSSDYLWMKYARNNDLKKRRNNTHGTWFLKNHLRKHPNFPSIACCKECTCNGLNAKLALLKWFPGILLILKDTISGHLFEGFSPFLNHQD